MNYSEDQRPSSFIAKLKHAIVIGEWTVPAGTILNCYREVAYPDHVTLNKDKIRNVIMAGNGNKPVPSQMLGWAERRVPIEYFSGHEGIKGHVPFDTRPGEVRHGAAYHPPVSLAGKNPGAISLRVDETNGTDVAKNEKDGRGYRPPLSMKEAQKVFTPGRLVSVRKESSSRYGWIGIVIGVSANKEHFSVMFPANYGATIDYKMRNAGDRLAPMLAVAKDRFEQVCSVMESAENASNILVKFLAQNKHYLDAHDDLNQMLHDSNRENMLSTCAHVWNELLKRNMESSETLDFLREKVNVQTNLIDGMSKANQVLIESRDEEVADLKCKVEYLDELASNKQIDATFQKGQADKLNKEVKILKGELKEANDKIAQLHQELDSSRLFRELHEAWKGRIKEAIRTGKVVVTR